MSNSRSEQIYAPNIHLFAFQLRQGLSVDAPIPEISTAWVEESYQKIADEFRITQPLSLRTDKPKSYQVNLLANTANQGRFYQNLSGEIDKNTGQTLPITGIAYPLQIGDSYALTLNLRRPQNQNQDEIDIDRLKSFNPENCFSPHSVNSNLGQTLLITAFLDRDKQQQSLKELRKLAAQCLMAFFKLSDPEQCPPFYQDGYLFNSPIFEYGNPKQPNKYGHILVWFFFDESTSEKLRDCYWELPELLLYRHKIITAYQNSREDYLPAYNKIGEIEETLGDFKQKYLPPSENAATAALPSSSSVQGSLPPANGSLSTVATGNLDSNLNRNLSPVKSPNKKILAETDLSELKFQLKELLRISLEYSQLQRNLEYYQNTIEINTYNYEQKLNQIEELANSDISFLKGFAQRECQTFKQQIQADLRYFGQGYSLLDKAIATIRGLVEIDQAERDRQLQTTIAVIGVGIGAGGIFAASYAFIDKTAIELPAFSLPLKPLHPFAQSLLYSLLFSLFAGGVTFWLMRRIQKRKSKK
jgi:hypothetical protein